MSKDVDRTFDYIAGGAATGGLLALPILFMPPQLAWLFYACTLGGSVGLAVHLATRREDLPPLPGEADKQEGC